MVALLVGIRPMQRALSGFALRCWVLLHLYSQAKFVGKAQAELVQKASMTVSRIAEVRIRRLSKHACNCTAWMLELQGSCQTRGSLVVALRLLRRSFMIAEGAANLSTILLTMGLVATSSGKLTNV